MKSKIRNKKNVKLKFVFIDKKTCKTMLMMPHTQLIDQWPATRISNIFRVIYKGYLMFVWISRNLSQMMCSMDKRISVKNRTLKDIIKSITWNSSFSVSLTELYTTLAQQNNISDTTRLIVSSLWFGSLVFDLYNNIKPKKCKIPATENEAIVNSNESIFLWITKCLSRQYLAR